jgi:RNA polymerase sigma-70 factor (sigma-E family)
MHALDDADFRNFVRAREHALLRTAYLLTGDRQTAEDLVQNALGKAVRHWSSIRAPAALEGYVRRIMYRDQVSAWRLRPSREVLAETVPEPRSVDRSGPYDQVDDRETLRTAMLKLGRRQRTVLVLRFYEDLTEEQVAAFLGISVGTVKSQTARALQNLRRAEPLLADQARDHARRPR